jgi:hypothetical protein
MPGIVLVWRAYPPKLHVILENAGTFGRFKHSMAAEFELVDTDVESEKFINFEKHVATKITFKRRTT